MFDFKKTMDHIVEDAIARKSIAGASVMVLHKGQEIYNACMGYADKENNVPMKKDTIFRMFSMSKPVTAVAAMILAERGEIDLHDNISKYIPEFADPTVIAADGKQIPADKEITIWHLLNMTSGISYPNLDTEPGKRMADIFDEIERDLKKGKPADTLEFCQRIAQVPLLCQPGEKWQYGASADVLGGVIQVASGKKFGEFLRDEIFAPLGMKDTAFYVPKEKWDRFARLYRWNEKTGELDPDFENHLGMEGYTEEVKFESGGAGLVSTIEDYSKFAQMMLGGGTYQGTRILGRKTVDMMTKDHLNSFQKVDYNWQSLWGYGYGCLMRVLINQGEAGSNASLGEFGWDGWTGNYVTMDPAEDFVLLYFIQKCDAGTTPEVRRLRMAAYAGI